MQTACWQLWFPIVLRELGTRHASPPRFDPVEAVTPPYRKSWRVLQFHSTTADYNRTMRIRCTPCRILLVPALLLLAFTASAGDMTRLNISVTTQSGKPIDRASVIVRFIEGHSIIKLGKAIRTSYELRTNQE